MFGKHTVRCPACRSVLVRRGRGGLNCVRCRMNITVARSNIRIDSRIYFDRAVKKAPVLPKTILPPSDPPMGSTVSVKAAQILRQEMATELAARSVRTDFLPPEKKDRPMNKKLEKGVFFKTEDKKPKRALRFVTICVLFILFIVMYFFADGVKNTFQSTSPFVDMYVEYVDAFFEKLGDIVSMIIAQIKGLFQWVGDWGAPSYYDTDPS